MKSGPFHAVIAITRGGLVPAAIVARELGLRDHRYGLHRRATTMTKQG